jgi:hypothetical protein
MSTWIKVDCGCCNGIQWGGETPRTCETCGGSGIFWISERDRIADWPGGPLRGSYPGEFARALKRHGLAEATA